MRTRLLLTLAAVLALGVAPTRVTAEDDGHLGDRHFHHPIPEEITFRGHPFLETVEAANAKAWFRADEEIAWLAAQGALGAMRLHHCRLVEDHRYRAGDQVFANVAMDPRYADETLRFTWADPYAVIEVGSRPTEILGPSVDMLRRTYRGFLDAYGDRLGLHDLMAPWGGRPDHRKGVRSFAEGAPLTVFLYRAPGPVRDLEVWFSGTGALHAVGTERLDEAAVAQLLRWFSRQKSKWAHRQGGRDALSEGFAIWFAARLRGAQGDRDLLESVRATAKAVAERNRPYPVFPLKDLVRLATHGQLAAYAAAEFSVPARAALRLFREQAWAVARMLHAGYGGLDPEVLTRLLDAWLRRETQFGMNQQVFARILDLRSDEDWASLEATWRRYLEEEIGLDVDGNTLRPDRWVLNVGGYRGNGSHQTAVTLRDDGKRRGRKLASVVLDPIPEDAPEALLAKRLDELIQALDLPGKRPVFVRQTPSKLGPPPLVDVHLVVGALWVAGYRDITLDDRIPPTATALLTTLRRGDGKAER